jgi:predicted  nucleic acid-binding Zn-ribbon protein
VSETPGSDQVKLKVRGRLEELARVSKELENNAKMQAAAPNIVAVEQLKKRVTDLTEQQNKMMSELVDLHPDSAARDRYHQLSQSIDELQLQVKAAQAIGDLKQLEAAMESTVAQYVHHFQTMMSDLMGAPRPDAPIFHKP